MPFMLIFLFAFALVVTFAGFFLTLKSHADIQNATFAQPRARSGQRYLAEASKASASASTPDLPPDVVYPARGETRVGCSNRHRDDRARA